MRGITPLAQCDGGILCAVDNGLAADEDASAIELVGAKDAFDPLPEVDWKNQCTSTGAVPAGVANQLTSEDLQTAFAI